jgi:preprotein translocase subunit SecD
MRVIENRLNGLGLSEIAIQRYGDPQNHEIQVQVPGKNDPRHILEIIQSTGLLEFRMVERGPFENAQAAAGVIRERRTGRNRDSSIAGKRPRQVLLCSSARGISFRPSPSHGDVVA